MPKRKKPSNPAGKPAAKAPATKTIARADRARILAEMNSTGMTAKQAAKKYGVSFWTVYGWRKNRSKARGGKPGKKSGVTRSTAKSSSRPSGSLGETLRPLIAQIVREEIARLVG